MASDARLDNLLASVYTVIFIAITSLGMAYLAQFVARLRGHTESEQRKVFWGILFAGPWISGFIIFVLGPAAASLVYSFTHYKLGKDVAWTDPHTYSLDNYRQMLLVQNRDGRNFNNAMLNSFYYALIGVPLQITAALTMAVLLNNEIPGIRAFRTIFYLPVILAGGPAILLAWRYMLTDNGGFVNEALQKFAQSFFVFDYLYRIYIYISESANGFYLGFANGDPVGPFKYVVPGLIMILLLLTLALGDWEESKRQRSLAFAQILGLITVYRLASKGLMAQPVNVSWIYFGAVLVLAGITHRAWQGKKDRLMRGLGILGLVGLALLLFYQVDFDITNRYWIALGVVAATLIGTLIGPWNRFKLTIFSAIIAALCVLIFVRAIPGELNGGRYQVLSKYLVFGSTIAHPHDENYLENVYPFESMSAMWIWGLGAAVLVLGAILNNGYPRARRYLLWGALIFFVLFTAGAFMDGRAYFNAFEEAAKIAGNKNFHFARFHESFDDFPTSQRVPKWMSSELWTKPSLILITMWSSGAGMLIFLAALKGVPESLYEAAKVDGASSVQRFFRITLPMISPAMFYNLVIGIIAALQTFDTIYILQNTNTESSLASAAYYLFNRTFRQLAVGDGAAMSWILVVIILTLTVLQFRFSRNWVHYEA